MNDRTRILYITGWLRSGTTILGNVLNELPGVMHIGELHYLWQNGLLRTGTNSLCGCGDDVHACTMWSSVLAGLPVDDLGRLATDMIAAQNATLRTRHVRSRLADARSGRQSATVTAAVDRMTGIYRAVAERGGERLVVDSSKFPAEAAALLNRTDLDVYVLHMVRDPRAISYSYLTGKAYISPMSPAASTSNWLGFNLASELVGGAAGGRYLRVRHEDFTASPQQTFEKIMRFVDLDGVSPIDAGGAVDLGINHTVTGNPDRLSRGTVTIRSDERWRTGLGRRHRAVTNAIALPLLHRYGYPLVAGRAAAGRVNAPRTPERSI